MKKLLNVIDDILNIVPDNEHEFKTQLCRIKLNCSNKEDTLYEELYELLCDYCANPLFVGIEWFDGAVNMWNSYIQQTIQKA